MHAVHALARCGGIASLGTLRAEGVAAAELQLECRRGNVSRLRRGWYALPGADPQVVAAVRAGGALDCLSVLRRVGIWVPRDAGFHIAIPRNSRRAPPACTVHWVLRDRADTTPVMPVPEAIAHAMRCAAPDERVAIIESALHQGRATRSQLLAAGVSPALLARCPGLSESGGESLARHRLAARNIRHRQQVWIDGVGRVDFLIGERCVLEVDGYAYHGNREAFERDRERDRVLVQLGYVVIRVSARQVEEEWPAVELALLAVIRDGRHRWPRRRAARASAGKQGVAGA